MFSNNELVRMIPNLKRFAFKLTGNRADAEDLLQTTILKSLENGDGFQEGTNLFSWTSRIMYNTFISQCRYRTRFDTQYDPQHYIDQKEVAADQEPATDLQTVLRAMSTLSEDHREILTLVCVDGMRYADVADQLGVPVGTVRSRLSRARDALERALEQGRARSEFAERMVA